MDDRHREAFRTIGDAAMAGERREAAAIPLALDGVVFRQMFEYPVADFASEAGFFLDVFGFGTIALSEDYALFTDAENAFFLSFRKVDAPQPLDALKLLFMTNDLDAAMRHLAGTRIGTSVRIGEGSPSQRVAYLATPAGLPVEIWEDPRPRTLA
ncbi:MAG: hypothetical protein WBA46_10885 [Thermomicrobiales bacterium]